MGRQIASSGALPALGPAMMLLRFVGAGALAGGGSTAITSGSVVAGGTVAGGGTLLAVGTATAVVTGGLAVGAAIHYSGFGKVIGTDAVGNALGDAVYRDVQKVKAGYQIAKQAITDWFDI